jgi:myosin-1
VNFPDHTKLIFSSDAGYCNFICLSLDATICLKETGDIPWKHIKEREILYGSLQQLLYGSVDKADAYKEITSGNSLREKLLFMQSVVDGWIAGGGLGCLAEPRDFLWDGPQLENEKKNDWVSVGRFGGDVF